MCQKHKTNISNLRKRLFDLNIHAIIIPSADPHQSEYLAEHWQLREWISGFTGSAGTVVITQDNAGLWTDSRYFLQAEQELEGSDMILFKQGDQDVPSVSQYLIDKLPAGSRVALNAKMWSHNSVKKMREKFEQHDIRIVTGRTLAEDLWNFDGRPALPQNQVFIHELQYAGTSVKRKLELVRKEMKDHDVEQHFISSLDDIAWTFNLRGYDIAYNPVFLSFAIVGMQKAILFIDPLKLNEDVIKHLNSAGVETHSYHEIDQYLTNLKQPVLINPDDCNEYLYELVNPDLIIEGPTITRMLKACKSSSEIKHIDHVMIKDGIALTKAFHHLYQNVHSSSITEAEFAQVISRFRSQQHGYYGESFPAIIGYQSNGAIVHYRPSIKDSALIKPEGLLLCDSGGQYLDGTTDITRTIAMGPVTEDQKTHYTMVLKGHIAIDCAVYPEGTTGAMLDILARQFLWRSGKNFGHGTGHGVGYFLNVHEPPQGISSGSGNRSTTAFKPGMLTSNEPGYYEDGKYGIRIENLIVTEKSAHKGYLRHRHVTLFPIDTTLIVQQMMTREEIEWINNYHQLVASKLIPHLEGSVVNWLRKACMTI